MLRSTSTWVPCLVHQIRPVLLALLLLLIPAPTHAGSHGRSAQFTTCPASLVYGELIQCAILSAAELDSYTFIASAGDELLVRAGTVSGDLRPNLRLYRPDGVIACTNSSPYSPLVEISCRLTVGGTYRLEIGGTQSAQTGSYGLQIERLNPPANAFISRGVWVKGTVAPALAVVGWHGCCYCSGRAFHCIGKRWKALPFSRSAVV